MTATREHGHWAETTWPRMWKSYAKPEPFRTVRLSCGCLVDFPEPIPPVGSALWCRRDGEVRVVSVG